METVGVLLIVVGVLIAVLGVVLLLVGRATGGAGLPGDVRFQIGNVSIMSPCLTMIIVSVVGSILLTVALNILMRFLNR